MHCEAEVWQAKKGKAVSCGKAAAIYRVTGEITSVYGRLCEGHAKKMRERGYKLENVDSACLEPS
jgi:hypothetical protein